MKPSLLEILCCPECKGNLSLKTGTSHDGELSCAICGRAYIIKEGIPRIFPIDYDTYTQGSFTREWQELGNGDQAWSLDIEKRKNDFLSMIGMSIKQVKGKMLLDVGCGDGTLTCALTDFGIEVVGLDITPAMERTLNMYPDKANFVQGDATTVPFKDKSFDLIWAGGSIHHTANTAKTFAGLVPLLKPGGRFGVWLYGPNWRPSLISEILRFFMKRFPVIFQDFLIDILANILLIRNKLLRLLKLRKGRFKSKGEMKHSLRDALTPNYAHNYTCKDVKPWFVQAGFKNIVCSEQLGAVVCYGDID